MKRLFSNMIPVFVVVIVMFLIIPLPVFLLDLMFILNIMISIVILLMTMYIGSALEFSIFPSLLLITTLLRLGLNVSSTRQILSNEGQAGQVIETFGTFVLQGNIIVGVIIFVIIVLVQFIVITKGAERVSEVAARFTLDAMPGKQMAIDADLSSGLITEMEARVRRINVQKEADFYGAMDGATKIVKGDAIMSIIITLINFLGGVVIGLVQSGRSFSEVLDIYSIATIGDGLVSQIPALLISTATGLIVTRSVSDSTLNADFTKQFSAQPRVLMISGAVVALFIVIPGAPKLQPLILATIFIGLGIVLSRRNGGTATKEEELPPAPLEEAVMDEGSYFKDINNVYGLLKVYPVELEFGYSLIPLADESSGGNLINRIVLFRRNFAQEMGFVVPSIHLKDSGRLNPNQYIIKVKGEEIARGEILVDYYLALEPPNPNGQIEGIEAIEPAYGIPSKWITPDQKDLAEVYGYTVIDPLSVILTHLFEEVRKCAHELLTRSEIVRFIENLKRTAPELVEEAVPAVVSYANLQRVLSALLAEGIPIVDLETILETIVSSTAYTQDWDIITENIRIALKRTITRKFCEDGALKVITLDSELEKTLLGSLTRSEQGTYLSVAPDVIQRILEQLMTHAKKFKDFSQTPIILTSHVIRVYLYRLLEQFYPGIYVLSFSEIASNVHIQALGNIAQ